MGCNSLRQGISMHLTHGGQLLVQEMLMFFTFVTLSKWFHLQSAVPHGVRAPSALEIRAQQREKRDPLQNLAAFKSEGT